MTTPTPSTRARIAEPGIYFGLPEAEYHGAFALSASGVKNLRISTLDFYMRSPLNPDQEDDDTDAKTIGRAYHKRIVEGRDAFNQAYAPALDRTEHPNAVCTIEDIKEALVKAGATPKGKRKEDFVAQLAEVDPSVPIWERLQSEHGRHHAGREFLSRKIIERIEVSAAMIENHPQLGQAFKGGYPEVSVFWTDPEHAIPMKARFDRLKTKAISDLKTFENVQGMPVDRAMARAVASYKYHIQGKLYLEAVQEAKALIRAGRVYGDVDKAFLDGLLASTDHTFFLVFQQKGVAPLARGMILPPTLLDIGAAELTDAKRTFADCWGRYGEDPWVDVSSVRTFDPTEFPAYLAE